MTIMKYIPSILTVSFVLLLASCTLHEEPELTADGEMGVDPTEVTIDANLTLNLTLPDRGEETGDLTVTATDEYRRRFIVEAYLNNQPVARQTFVESVTDRTQLTLPVSMKLHARNYELAVWSDYVSAETPDEDLYYNTSSLVPVIPNRASHTGNTEYKDVFAGRTTLDLTSYADAWDATVETDIELTRPVARYELIATDVEAFLQRIADGEVTGDSFTARLKYSDYTPMGYNVLTDEPRHSLMYMQYTVRFNAPDADDEELRIGFDYVFVEADDTKSVPMEVEIVDENSVTIANSVVNVVLERGKNTTLRTRFLTRQDEDGVSIDPGYDGETDIDIGEIH